MSFDRPRGAIEKKQECSNAGPTRWRNKCYGGRKHSTRNVVKYDAREELVKTIKNEINTKIFSSADCFRYALLGPSSMYTGRSSGISTWQNTYLGLKVYEINFSLMSPSFPISTIHVITTTRSCGSC